MNLCKRGHDKDVVGITEQRVCRQCKRELNRVAQRARRAGRTSRGYVRAPTRVAPVLDGLEAQYGPIPDLVPDHEWYDHVIVDRALTGHATGRPPYPLEQAGIVRRMTPIHEQADLAKLCGVHPTTFNVWVSQHG